MNPFVVSEYGSGDGYKFGRFGAGQIRDFTKDDEESNSMNINEAQSFLSVMVDLVRPDVPAGFTAEEFAESWDRQINEMTAHE